MNYFKPAAGLIILIFVLVVSFVLFLDYRAETKEREKRTSLETCIESAEYMRSVEEDMGQRYVDSHIEVGDFDFYMQQCMATKWTPPYQTEGLYESQRATNEMSCRSLVTEQIKKNFNSDDATIEAKYNDAVSVCKAKYGQ